LIDTNELESEKGTFPKMDISKLKLTEKYSSVVAKSANIKFSGLWMLHEQYLYISVRF
jgi:hypothetical protein